MFLVNTVNEFNCVDVKLADKCCRTYRFFFVLGTLYHFIGKYVFKWLLNVNDSCFVVFFIAETNTFL